MEERYLKKYAELLVRYALGGGEGIRSGDVVYLMVPLCAWEFAKYLRRSVLEAGGHPIFGLTWDDQRGRDFYEIGNDEQIGFVPEKLLVGMVEEIDHVVRILAEEDKYLLQGIEPKKLMLGQKALSSLRTKYREKENRGELTWVLASYATQSEAKEAGMSLDEYWAQIIRACYLDYDNPIVEWKKIQTEQTRIREILNEMKIEKVHVVSEHVDLWVKIGANRQWLGGSGRNIPSFEIFTSPDWRGTTGRIKFDVPLYRYGNRISGAEVVFRDGVVVDAKADEGVDLFREMLRVPNADKLGEFSLTDKRMSRIDKFMGQTLYDENYGGDYGNTHVAFGSAYRDAYAGELRSVNEEEWMAYGFNDSPEHTDLFSIENRSVVAYLANGEECLIYKDGEFQL